MAQVLGISHQSNDEYIDHLEPAEAYLQCMHIAKSVSATGTLDLGPSVTQPSIIVQPHSSTFGIRICASVRNLRFTKRRTLGRHTRGTGHTASTARNCAALVRQQLESRDKQHLAINGKYITTSSVLAGNKAKLKLTDSVELSITREASSCAAIR
jgi:hypothetical protein